MFHRSAMYYDLLYGFKDYEAEVNVVRARLHAAHPAAGSILDAACGTGEHDRHLAKHYEVDGLDICEEFLSVARAKNPAGRYFGGDMADFDLGRRYDAVLCLFSSIGYILSLDGVTSALRCFRRHLKPGGVILVEPWFTPEKWKPGGMHMLTAESGDCKICRMNLSEQEGRLSVMDFHCLVISAAGVDYFSERHELGLYTIEEMRAAFASAGLSADYDAEGITGRGLYTAHITGN